MGLPPMTLLRLCIRNKQVQYKSKHECDGIQTHTIFNRRVRILTGYYRFEIVQQIQGRTEMSAFFSAVAEETIFSGEYSQSFSRI